jgi:hypothetical protein
MPADTQLVSLGGLAKRKQKAHSASSTGYSFAVRQTVQLDDCWKEKNPHLFRRAATRAPSRFQRLGTQAIRGLSTNFLIRNAGKEKRPSYAFGHSRTY